MRNSHGFLIPSRWGGIGIPLIGAFSLLIGANQAFVQVTQIPLTRPLIPRIAAEQAGNNIVKIVKKHLQNC